MASPITPATGLGSGIAIGSIVDALVAAEKTPKQNQIDKQTSLTTTKLTGIGTLKSALDAFQTALTKLGSTTTPAFNGYAATSSSTGVTAVATNTAVPGTYTVTVDKLASSSSVASAAFAGGTSSAIPSGKLTITQNGIDSSYDVPADSTLQSVRDLINTKTSTTGLTANIITDTNGSRLVFGSTKTGEGTDLSVSGIAGLEVDPDTPLDLTPGATTGGYIGTKASDAAMTIGGLSVTSSSNTFDKALGGVTLTATALNATSTITVANNNDGLKASLQTFVDAYNTVVKTITSLTKATADSDGALTKSAAMTGDAMPRNILAALRSVLSSEGAGSKLTSLGQLGIMTDRGAAGTISLDATKFAAAMNDKGLAGEIQTMFVGTTPENGLVARMTKKLTPYTETGGILADRTTELNKAQKTLTQQQEALDLRITNLTTSLTAKYNAMDLLVGQMKASATSITSFFEALNAQQS